MHYVCDITDEPEHTLLDGLHDPAAGRIVAPFLAGEGSASALARAIAQGLGKQMNRYGWVGGGQRNAELLQAWMLGDDIRELIIPRAHLIRDRSAWRYLGELARLTGVEVWLLIQGTAPSAIQLDMFERLGATEAAWSTFEQRFAAASNTQRRRATQRPRPLPELPFGDPFGFFTTLEALVGPVEYPRVEALFEEYHHEFDAGLGRLPGHDVERLVYRTLQRSLVQAACRNDALLRLRAAHSVLFERGWLLSSVDADVVAFTARARAASLDRDTSLILRRYLRTGHACAAAIRLATHASAQQITSLRIADVATDGSSVRIGDETTAIDPHGQGILRAHLIQRAGEGANTDAPLLLALPQNPHETPTRPLSARGLHQILRVMQNETGLPLADDLNAAAAKNVTRTDLRDWAKQVGLRLLPLTTHNVVRERNRHRTT